MQDTPSVLLQIHYSSLVLQYSCITAKRLWVQTHVEFWMFLLPLQKANMPGWVVFSLTSSQHSERLELQFPSLLCFCDFGALLWILHQWTHLLLLKRSELWKLLPFLYKPSDPEVSLCCPLLDAERNWVSSKWKQTVDTQMSSKVRKETRGGGGRGGRLPGMSFLRAIAAALWDSYSTKAKPRFLFLSVVLGYTIASTTPSVTWTHRRRGGGAETEIWETHTASEKRANSTTGRVKGIIWF